MPRRSLACVLVVFSEWFSNDIRDPGGEPQEPKEAALTDAFFSSHQRLIGWKIAAQPVIHPLKNDCLDCMNGIRCLSMGISRGSPEDASG